MPEIAAHDPETGDHDRPKRPISLQRNQCSRWREIRTQASEPGGRAVAARFVKSASRDAAAEKAMAGSIRAKHRQSGAAVCRWWRQLVILLALIALGWTFGSAFASESEEANNESATEAEAGEWHHVTRVIDGDILVLAGGARVRLIGVDTPETVHA